MKTSLGHVFHILDHNSVAAAAHDLSVDDDYDVGSVSSHTRKTTNFVSQ